MIHKILFTTLPMAHLLYYKIVYAHLKEYINYLLVSIKTLNKDVENQKPQQDTDFKSTASSSTNFRIDIKT